MLNLLSFFLVLIGFIVYAVIRWRTASENTNRQVKSVEKEKESNDAKGKFVIFIRLSTTVP